LLGHFFKFFFSLSFEDLNYIIPNFSTFDFVVDTNFDVILYIPHFLGLDFNVDVVGFAPKSFIHPNYEVSRFEVVLVQRNNCKFCVKESIPKILFF
jgi:hypothetical protein